MKRIFLFFTILLSVFSLIGCNSDSLSQPDPIKTYQDIPGVTEEEITAIETLKTHRDYFLYGALLSAEAYFLQDGYYTGFTAKFCELLTDLFGIPFVMGIYEWDELLESVDALSVDFTGELAPTNERMQRYGMTFPIAERMLRIFLHVDSSKIQAETDLSGLKIGFLRGSTTADSIKRAYPIPFYEIPVANYRAAAEMIKTGEIDAFVDEAVADPFFEDFDFIYSLIFFPMVHEPVSVATANPELAPVISVISKYIAVGGIDRLYELYKQEEFEYSKNKLYRSFTDEEINYINDLAARGAAIGVAYERDNYPIGFYNREENELQGIAIDVLAEISKLTGLKFEAIDGGHTVWSEIVEKTKSGEILMIADILPSVARRSDLMWSKAPYTHSFFAIMSKSDYPNLATYQVGRALVGVLKESGYEEVYHELFPNNNNIKRFETLEECLDALERGEVELLMASEYMLLTQTHYREKSDYKINIKFNALKSSYFGFNKDEKVLCSIISKTQQYVKTEEIEIDWSGKLFGYSKKAAENRVFFLSVFAAILLIILFATIFLFIKNINLRKQLEEIANKDTLTAILNRRYFMELAIAQVQRSLRTGGNCFIVIYDLDRFKAVNDKYGHLAGDKVLKEIAQRVKQSIRLYDLFGRYGGEEFIILMPDIDKANVINAVERIREDICKSPVEFEGKAIRIAASFGIAYAAPFVDLDTAIRQADEALYQAKKTGRNRTVFYENKIRDC